VTGVDVLFSVDAADFRPQWTLLQASLLLNARPDLLVARLTFRHGSADPAPDGPPLLRANMDGVFKIVQLSDTHMVTGVRVCKNAIDTHGQPLPEC